MLLLLRTKCQSVGGCRCCCPPPHSKLMMLACCLFHTDFSGQTGLSGRADTMRSDINTHTQTNAYTHGHTVHRRQWVGCATCNIGKEPPKNERENETMLITILSRPPPLPSPIMHAVHMYIFHSHELDIVWVCTERATIVPNQLAQHSFHKYN